MLTTLVILKSLSIAELRLKKLDADTNQVQLFWNISAIIYLLIETSKQSIWPKFFPYRKIWALYVGNLSHQTVSEKKNTQGAFFNIIVRWWFIGTLKLCKLFSICINFECCIHATFHIKLYQKRKIHNDAFLNIIVRWFIGSLKLSKLFSIYVI